MFIDKIHDKDLKEFAEICSQTLGINEAYVIAKAKASFLYYMGKIENYGRGFEDRWFSSIEQENPKPDYSVYDDIEMIPDLFACWKIYSRKYLKTICNDRSMINKSIKTDLGEIKSVIDLGCGIGYTTAALKQIFPEAEVYGTNIKGTKQYKLCEQLASPFRFKMIENHKEIETVDLIFASEYFEHIEEPVKNLTELLTHLSPKALIIANSFNTRACGHFHFYYHNGQKIPEGKISKIFNDSLRGFGYMKMATNCWNNRPTYWKK